ncbi:unnamed protein product, partial [Lymnaea stagnalis]
LFSFLGIVTNFINIMVFFRHGVTSDSPTVAFFTLSVSDVLGCITMLPEPICFYLEDHVKTDNIFVRNCYELTFLPATYTHIILYKVTSFVTVYMSVERAICVIFPLKVRRIIKVKNTVVIIVLICVLTVISYMPYAANVFILWVPDPNNNGTFKAKNYLTALGQIFTTSNSIFHSFFLTTAALLIVTITTVVMVARLKASMKWRKRAISPVATSGLSNGINNSNTRSTGSVETVKIVTAITVVYLVCLTCTHIPNMAAVAIPGMTVNGHNRFLNEILYTVRFNFDVFSSSVHLFFYVRMSSKYRKTFHSLFHKRQRGRH